MKKIVLLGDSIRMSYQAEVFSKLGDGFECWAPDYNCRFAKFTLFELPNWADNFKNADVIHWNNGLWDVMVRHIQDGSFTPIDEYLTDLSRIFRELSKTGAKIIFALTTPVSEKNPTRSNKVIAEYNKAAAELLSSKGAVINDLYSLVYPHMGEYIQEDMVHLTEEGIEACAEAVYQACSLAARSSGVGC